MNCLRNNHGSCLDIKKYLIYFKKKFHDVAAFQIYLKGKKDYTSTEGIRCIPALNFLKDFI